MNVSIESDFRFPAERRVKSSLDFDKIWKSRVYAADQILVINAIDRSDTRPSRVGLSIGRKYGNAVRRNSWKRLVREVFRKHAWRIPAGVDLVMRPRAGCEHPDYSAVERSFIDLAVRLGKRLKK